jgi:hypothetical protein
MGSDNFFSKAASIDPLAQALNLPGAHKYAQAQAQDVQTNPGPYAGVTPTLAGANAGYVAGGPGATSAWTPNQNTGGGNGLFHVLQGGANGISNNFVPVHPGANGAPTYTGNNMGSFGNPNVQGSTTQNPYVTAARGAAAAGGQ